MTTLADYLNELTPDGLRTLFGAGLLWGIRRGSFALPVGAPIRQTLTLHHIAEAAGVPVFAVVAPTIPSLSARRAIFRALSTRAAEHVVVYLTSDADQALFVSPRPRAHPDAPVELRALPFERGLPARTTLEQLAKLRLTLDSQPTTSDVRQRLLDAFSVEAVTQRFFDGYRRLFDLLQAELRPQSDDPRWAHDFALQLLNRLLFLYFIQRKRFTDGPFWLANDRQFVLNFWRAYQQSRAQNANFYADWLSILFFGAFNQRFQAGRSDRQYLPENIREALASMPFLNGGLFTPNALDRRLDDSSKPVVIPDDFFGLLFDCFDGSTPGFLERYNFTVTESTPLDVEVAVDPEMIGKVSENLVNLTERGRIAADLRGSAGIFYTPRVEIDLMCRLALVHALAERLPDTPRDLLYDWVFATDPDTKANADEQVFAQNLWRALDEHVRSLTVCDPACGSGSFLVGMLQVLDDLQARCNVALGREESTYQRRRRIIGEQLYGVDAMDWAVHVAELRLWLQLTVETDLKQAEAQLKPLLPNLSFKLRSGDSLVQELGGVNLGLHQRGEGLPAALKGEITRLKSRKLRFYQASRDNKTREPLPTEAELRQEERRVFREILRHRLKALGEREKAITRELETLPQAQLGLGVAVVEARDPVAAKRTALKAEQAALTSKRTYLEKALQALDAGERTPFMWDIDFVEIFGEEGGFDIIIGNPPYVRQEIIAPPGSDPEAFGGEGSERWRAHKQDYKAKLQAAVAAAFPRFFNYRPGVQKFRTLNKQSDLYVYFYLYALSLLNPRGVLCFITSNSWLDVAYGADLQEFLLKHSHLKLVIENLHKRSFSQADVNTAIALLGAADDRTENGLDRIARFVAFTAPFDQVGTAATFKAIEAAQVRTRTESWRVTPVRQRDLLAEGMAHAEDEEDTPREGTAVRYAGGKWGSKYLRAPDIFFVILEKGKDKFTRLGDVAKMWRGFTTGANEFFYLEPIGKTVAEVAQAGPKDLIAVRNAAGWKGEIEARFLRPVLKSPRECCSVVVRLEDLSNVIFMCREDKPALEGSRALHYILWGEAQGYPARPSCKGRARWWDLGVQSSFDFVALRFRHERNWTPINEIHGLFAGDIMFVGAWKDRESVHIWNALANSTLTLLSSELLGRVNLGEGLLTTYGPEIAQFLVLKPQSINNDNAKAKLVEAFEQLKSRNVLSVFEEVKQSDRRQLDELVFDVLGLTSGERAAVYEAVVELVQARLARAQSV